MSAINCALYLLILRDDTLIQLYILVNIDDFDIELIQLLILIESQLAWLVIITTPRTGKHDTVRYNSV